MKNLYKLFLFVIVCVTFTKISCHSMEETSALDKPLIKYDLMNYYVDKRPLRVEISIGEPTGRGERVLDFFIVGNDERIPLTLREILEKSSFIQTMLSQLFNTSDVLMVNESVSGIEGEQKINGFIGIKKTDLG